MYTLLCDMTLVELANAMIETGEYVPEICAEICRRADMVDEWEAADGETFESVLYRAARILNINID